MEVYLIIVNRSGEKREIEESISSKVYFVSISHFLVIIQSGQKLESPAINGIAPK